MSIHIRNLKKDKNAKKNKSAELVPIFTTVIKLVFISVVIFMVINYRVSLNEKTERLNKEATGLRKKIDSMDREIKNLKIQKETFSSWPHIKQKIAEFKIPLRNADPSQVKNLVLLRVIPNDKDKALSLSQR